jgi:hypothetical protein
MSEKSTVTKIPEPVSMMAIDCSTENVCQTVTFRPFLPMRSKGHGKAQKNKDSHGPTTSARARVSINELYPLPNPVVRSTEWSHAALRDVVVVVVVVVVVCVLDFVVGVSAFVVVVGTGVSAFVVACCWRVGFSLFTCGELAGSLNEASTVFSYTFDSLLAL